MDNQKRYILLFIVIFAIGALAYSFLVPSFETTDFNPDVIEDISKGITTTSTTSDVNNDDTQEVSNEEVVEEPIEIVDEGTAQELIKFTVADSSLENLTTYLIIGSDERTDNSSASRGYVDGQRADVIILGIINEASSDKYLLSIPRDLLIKNSCTKLIERINSTFSKNNCGNSAENLAANIQILTGLTVNHFASFNFEGFENIIDSFGGIEICVEMAQNGGNGLVVYNRKEGRALGEVTKFLVYNARKRQSGGDSASNYFHRTECVAGVVDARFQEFMPDVLHWFGIKRIHNLISMSDMKYDAIVNSGIKVDKRISIPDELVPDDARVEIEAKKAAGYYVPEDSDNKNNIKELDKVKGRDLDD